MNEVHAVVVSVIDEDHQSISLIKNPSVDKYRFFEADPTIHRSSRPESRSMIITDFYLLIIYLFSLRR